MPTRLQIQTGLLARRNWLNATVTRNGGLTFVRVGRFQFSFCVCRSHR
jgi:hypothetical protein